MKKWEYFIYQLSPQEEVDETLDQLDKLGDSGWELVAVLPEVENSYGVYVFKKPA